MAATRAASRLIMSRSHRLSSSSAPGRLAPRRAPPLVPPRTLTLRRAGAADGESGERAAETGTERAATSSSSDKAWEVAWERRGRMWTAADKWHAHGVSGGVFTVLGGGLLLGWAGQALRGGGTPAEALEGTEVAVTVLSLALATVCAVTGLPLGRSRGWRKVELSARSLAFQVVLTWQALRLLPGGFGLEGLDPLLLPASVLPFVWQALTSTYILTQTTDDKRSAIAIFLGVSLFGLQIFPLAVAAGGEGGLAAVAQLRPGLTTVWLHSLVGLVWLLNWSTLGASMRARKVVDDVSYRSAFLLRPGAFWLLLFAADVAHYVPFASIGDYFSSCAGALV